MVRKHPHPSLPGLDQQGEGRNWVPTTPEWFRSLPIFDTGRRVCFLSLYPRIFIVRLWACFHHGGHFDADVFRHHGPRFPLLHHLHAVIMLPAAEAAGVHSGRCSIFFPASRIFVMDNGRGPFQDAYENALKTKFDLTYPRDANLCRQFWFTSSMSIYTDHVVTTWRYWYSTMRPMIVSTCFRPAVACLTSRDVVVMVSQWSIHSE